MEKNGKGFLWEADEPKEAALEPSLISTTQYGSHFSEGTTLDHAAIWQTWDNLQTSPGLLEILVV